MTRTPTMQEALDGLMRQGLEDLYVSTPGRIVRYDADTQQATIQPLIKRAYLDEEGNRVVEAMPLLVGVPVVFPGAGGYRITFPVAKGDTCLVVFCDSSIDKWLHGGGGPVDPELNHSHSLADAVAFVGLRDVRRAWKSAPTDRMTLGKDDGPQLHINGTTIEAKNSGPALHLATLADLQALLAAITNAVVVAADGGASFKSTLLLALEDISWPTGTSVLKGE